MKNPSDKYFYFGILVLGAYFIFRLIDQAKIITFFPLDYGNDISSVLAQLYFLAEFGFHGIVPYWYNGFELFLVYYPGWFYFALPIYYLTKNLQMTWYLALIIVHSLAFLLFLLLAKIEKFSLVKGTFFFLFFFANPISIGNFIRLGRTAEFFGWLFFIALFIMIIYYKDRKLDWKFFLFILLYSALILTHPTPLILISILLLSLFLVKNFGEKVVIIFCFFLASIISSFWWVPYLSNLGNTSTGLIDYTSSLFLFSGRFLFSNLAGIFASLAFIFLFYIYYSKNKNKKELLFYAPSLILAGLFLFRIVHLIPFLNKIQPDAYTLFFIFLGFYLFLKMDFNIYPKLKYLSYPTLIILPVLFVVASIIYTPLYHEHGNLEDELGSLMPLIEGKYIMFGSVYSTPRAGAYYSYNAIFHNLSTPSGWSPQYASTELNKKLNDVGSFRERDTEKFLNVFNDLDLKNIVTFGKHCDYLESLKEFELVKETDNACLHVKN